MANHVYILTTVNTVARAEASAQEGLGILYVLI